MTMKSQRLPKNPPTAKASFIKMAIAGVALIVLVLICVGAIDPGLRATLLTFVAIVVFYQVRCYSGSTLERPLSAAKYRAALLINLLRS